MKRNFFASQALSRRTFLHRGYAAAAAVAAPALLSGRAAVLASESATGAVIDADSLRYLTELTAATIEASRIRPGQSRVSSQPPRPGAAAPLKYRPVDIQPNTTGVTIICPGGGYPSLWTRDFAMSLDCGLIDAAEILPQLRLFAKCQNGEKERKLPNGAMIPPWAIVDHVNLTGGAVYYPGSYSSDHNQGGGPAGPLPPIDDHYYFTHVAYAVWRDTGDAKFLEETIDGVSLADRLELAFRAPPFDPKTGAAVTDKDRRAVGFGFQDSVYVLGALSFTTLLRYRAARQLAEMLRARGQNQAAANYDETADVIAKHFAQVFADPEKRDGWLVAATEVCRQPDVWATLFALHLDVLPDEAAGRARETVLKAVRAPGHTVEFQGGVRHVPSDHFFRSNQCWERGSGGVNNYQNGAFWHTPTGWLIEALLPVDPALARRICRQFIEHLREDDFRNHEDGRGAPWERYYLQPNQRWNPVYMTSVTLPLAVLQDIASGKRRTLSG